MSGDHKSQFSALRAQLQNESADGLAVLRNVRDNPVCSITIDDEVPCICIVWKRYATRTQLRFIHEYLLQLLKPGMKILGDDTGLETISSEDQAWILDDWMPRAIAAGLHVAATKTPASYFGRLAVNKLRTAAPAGLVIRSFDDLDTAREWLRAQP